MTGFSTPSAPNGPLQKWVPTTALATLPAAWLVLALTLPTTDDRGLTVDVSCTSGNAVVAVWIESRSGGSQFAQESQPGTSTIKRFTFQQAFSDQYQVRAGCGGTPQQWGVTAMSSFDDRPYRRLLCDDVGLVGTITDSCLDQPPQ